MSKMGELIERLCPDGIEFKKMGDVGEFVRGHGLPKTDFTESGIGCIHYGQIYTYYGTFTYKTKSFVSEETARKLKKVQHGNLVIASTSENIEDVCKTVAWLGEDEIVTGGHATIFRHNENPQYLSYLMQTDFFFEQKIKYAKGTKVIDVSAKEMAKISIPVPPLEVQNEIVSILDKFTFLEAELEAELEARRTQYEHYKEALLSFESKNVEWKTLGEIGQFLRGNGLQKSDFKESGVGCIHYGQIYTYYKTYTDKTKSFVSAELAKKLKKASKNDLIIAGVSENIEDVCKAVVWLGEDDICISGDSFAFRHQQNPKFIGYLFQTKRFLEFKRKYAQGAKVTRLRSGSLPKYTIPIPSLEEQEKIVSFLDKFDVLLNDISTGIPAEIEGRRQQYEYYRNRLLTFKNINNG